MRHVESFQRDRWHRYTVYSNAGRDELMLVVYADGNRVTLNVHIKKDDALALGQALIDEANEPSGDDEPPIDDGIDIDFPLDIDEYRDGAL